MSDGKSKSEIIAGLAEEFVERCRRGEHPAVSEYTRQHPELAEEIREFFAAVAMVEDLAPAESESFGDVDSSATSAALPELKQLGDYRIIREVGRGGMGVVYEAEQVSLGRHVALKVLPAAALPDDKHIRRFEREAKSAAKLHHTNIVPVFGVGAEQELHYYVMQFIQGLPLDEVIDELKQIRAQPSGTITAAPVRVTETGPASREAEPEYSVTDMARSLMTGQFAQTFIGDSDSLDNAESAQPNLVQTVTELSPQAGDTSTSKLSETFNLSGSFSGSSVRLGKSGSQSSQQKPFTYWESVANIGLQVADAMQYAHDQGILHRDIKPSNLLLDMRGTAWVTDFGLAKATDQQDITHTGDILGTLRYMPPEAFEGKADPRSDVYSLGLTLYELLCFQPAFGMKDRNRLVKQVTTEAAPRLEKLNPEIPRDLVTIVHKAVDREPSHRYQNARELQEDLQRFLEDEPIRARRISTTERLARWSRRNKGLAASLAAVCVLLLVINIAGPVMFWQVSDLNVSLEGTVTSLERTRDELTDEKNRADEEAERATALAADEAAAREQADQLLYATDMQLAEQIWRDDEATAAELRDRLSAHVPGEGEKDRRGFEWYWHDHLVNHGATVFHHPANVLAAAMNADDDLITLDQDLKLRRWDQATRRETTTIDLRQGRNVSVTALSPDGRLAALAVGDTIQIVDTTTGTVLRQLTSDDSSGPLDRGYSALTFSGDGRTLVTVNSFRSRIRWWDTTTGEQRAVEELGTVRVPLLWLSRDGQVLAVTHGQYLSLVSIYRLNPATNEVTSHLKDFNRTLGAGVLSPDGQLLAMSGFYAGGVSVYETENLRAVTTNSSAHASPPTAMVFSEDGGRLVTAAGDGTVRIWPDARNFEESARTLKGHEGSVQHLFLSPDENLLVSSGADDTARVWDLTGSDAAVQRLAGVEGQVYDAEFSPDGLLVAVTDGQDVGLHDAATGSRVRLLSGREGDAYSLAFAPDGDLLAVGYGNGSGETPVSHVLLWDIDTGQQLARLTGVSDIPGFTWDEDNGTVAALAFSPDGRYLVVGFGRPTLFNNPGAIPLKVWEVATRRLVARLEGHDGHCVSLEFSPDGELLASGSYDGTARIWSTRSWQTLHVLENPDPLETRGYREFGDVAFSPDGGLLALASQIGSVVLWDFESGSHEILTGHQTAVQAVAFSPDGRTLASASADDTVRLWNMETRRQMLRLRAGDANALAFSPDGRQLLSAGEVDSIRSAIPLLWHDSDRAAARLNALRDAPVDFQSRIRMLSENLRIHEALQVLARERSDDPDVQAALAATRANWFASRQQWRLASLEFDRLKDLSPDNAADWLRTPGLLRLATALLHEQRPQDAARLMTGGAQRRIEDGINVVATMVGLGINETTDESVIRIESLVPDSPADRSSLRVGDVILQVNGAAPTELPIPELLYSSQGDAGTVVRLRVQHPNTDQSEEIELVTDRFPYDSATGDLLQPLLTAVNARLDLTPRDAGLLELRAELAGQWAGREGRVADYTAAIESLTDSAPEETAAQLARLYRRRGDAHLALENWQAATDDYSRADEKLDEELAPQRALAEANSLLDAVPQEATPDRLARAHEIEDPWLKLAAAHRLHDNQQAVDQLVARRPELAGPVADLFAADQRWERALAFYNLAVADETDDAELLSSRANVLEHLAEWDAAAADWVRAAAGSPNAAALLADFAERLTEQGQVQLALDHYAHARQILERDLAEDPDSAIIAHQLTDVLLAGTTVWSVLEPVNPTSKEGATLRPQSDGSILAEGPNTPGDVYTIPAPVGIPEIRAIRLEALPDSSLPRQGPGRHPIGNFFLEALRVYVASAEDGEPTDPLPIAHVRASFEYEAVNAAVIGTINDSDPRFWHVYGRTGERHVAVFELASPVRLQPGQRLIVECAHVGGDDPTSLGRFRLSVTGSPDVLESVPERWRIAEIDDHRERLGTAYATIGESTKAAEWFARALEHASAFADRLNLVDRIDELETDLAGIMALRPNDPLLLRALAKHQIEAGDSQAAAESLARARRLTESLLAEFPADAALANFLVDVLTTGTTRWQVLQPSEMTFDADATLTPQPDGSILASGTNVTGDVYTIRAAAGVSQIRAIRLEALPDPTLPYWGPGRHASGNFKLKAFRVFEATDDDEPANPISIADAWASFETTPRRILATINDDDPRSWHVWRGTSQRQFAVFELATPLRIQPEQTLIIQCEHTEDEVGPNLGRFRLSVTDNPTAFDTNERSFAVSKIEDPWQRLAAAYDALGDSEQAAEWLARALEQASGLTARRELVEQIVKLQTELGGLVALCPDDPLLLRALAQRQVEAGEADAAAESLARARSLTESMLADSPDDETLAGFLADLLLADTTDWTVLKPRDVASREDTTFTTLDDHSVLAGGPNPDYDDYTVTADTDLQHVTAIRLEALTHDSLPGQGPGRWPIHPGVFVMSSFHVTAASPQTPDSPVEVTLDDATADYFYPDLPITPGMWHIGLGGGKPYVAVYRLGEPLQAPDGPRLSFEMSFGTRGETRLQLGRFRIAVTDDPAAFELMDRRVEILRIDDSRARLGAAYSAIGDFDRAAEWFARALERSPDFSSRRDLVDRVEQPLMDELIALRPDDPLLWRAQTHRLVADGRSEAAARSLAQARSLTEAMLAESPHDEALAGLLADLLLEDPTGWTLLKPDQMTSAGRATMTPQEDGSILVGGINPPRDTYTVHARAPNLERIAAIRLEALTDVTLPQNGPGRQVNGNFHLAELCVLDGDSPVGLTDIFVRHDEAGQFPAVIDGELDMQLGWSNGRRSGEKNSAVILTDGIHTLNEMLTIELYFSRSRWEGYNLGRFRLSVTDKLGVAESMRQRWLAAEINDPWARLGAAYAAAGDSTQAAGFFARALERAPDFAARLELFQRFDQPQTNLDDLVALRAEDPLLWSALAQRQAAAAEPERAAESYARARRLTESLLAKSPADETLAGFLADLLLRDTTRWTVLEPVESPTSAGDATMELQPDGSIFVSGTNPDEDLYTIVLPLTSANIRALRLETLTDERLPFAASGRSTINGNFHIGEFSLSLRTADSPDVETPIHVTRAHADVAGSAGRVIERVIDGDRSSKWTPYPLQSSNHKAVFEFQLPPAATDGQRQLIVRMDTGPSQYPEHGLGRFRLSVTEDLSFTAAMLQEPWLKLAAAYAIEGNADAAADCFVRAIETSRNFAATWDRITELPADLLKLMCEPDEVERLVEEQFARSTPGVRQQVWTRPAGNGWSQFYRKRQAFHDLITQKQSEGMRPTFLSAGHGADLQDTLFLTIWSNDGREHRIEPALTRRELDNLLDTLPEDMQLVSLEEYVDGGSTHYAALWVAQTTLASWELHERLSASETADLSESMQTRGFRPTYVNSYPDGTLTTVWIQDDGDSELLFGLTHQDLRELEQKRSNDGLPICIDSHFDGNRRRYSVVIDNSVADVEWKFTLLERRSEFQNAFDREVAAGWEPIVTTESPTELLPGSAD